MGAEIVPHGVVPGPYVRRCIADLGGRRAVTVTRATKAANTRRAAHPDPCPGAPGPARAPGVPGDRPPWPSPVLEIRDMRVPWPGGCRTIAPLPDLRLSQGRRLAVLGGGTDGIGGSVLISVLLGLSAYEGSVTLDGIELRDLSRDRIRRLIGFAGRPPMTMIRTFGERLAIARSLLAEHPIVLFEEPDADLDDERACELFAGLLAAATAQGRTVVLMTRRAEYPGADPVLKHLDETVTLR